jgi:WD40 repeat protein
VYAKVLSSSNNLLALNKKSIHNLDLFLVQDLRPHSDSIVCAVFSSCGRYLATGGKDAVLKIWEVSLNP